jgi:hypothetical protein
MGLPGLALLRLSCFFFFFCFAVSFPLGMIDDSLRRSSERPSTIGLGERAPARCALV